MAHFAELKQKTDPTGFTSDKHWVVIRVIVVDNRYVDGDEHVSGEDWCKNFFGGGVWKQTSYNHNFRKKYAGAGNVYDYDKNKFINPQPFASWSLDANDDWQSPVAAPSPADSADYIVSWDEDNRQWTGINKETQSNKNWDASALAWVSA